MKRTRIHLFQTDIDSNYTAHKGYIPIPVNVRSIKSVCCVLHNAEGYVSLLKELDNEQIINDMCLSDDKMHINSKKVEVSVMPDNADLLFVLRLTKIGFGDEVGRTKSNPIYKSDCKLKIIIEYEEDV